MDKQAPFRIDDRMDESMPFRTDSQIHAIAAGQHGVVTRRQLIEAGVTPIRIQRRLRAGRLVGVHRGVYRVGPVIAPRASEMAACLACGDGAALSHRSAAALWEVPAPSPPDSLVEVSLRRGNRKRPGIKIHRPLDLQDDCITVLAGIPLTTPIRTLTDLATCLRARDLERALSELFALGLADAAQVRDAVSRRAGFSGAALLLDLLGRAPALTRSEAEERFLTLVGKAQLEAPAVNRRVAGHEIDFLWKSRGLAVEIDGFAFHSSRSAFERDRRRDASLAARGIHVVRVTWRQLMDEPEAVLVRLAQALARAR
jgi:very-short-patch-repair endonuclease